MTKNKSRGHHKNYLQAPEHHDWYHDILFRSLHRDDSFLQATHE